MTDRPHERPPSRSDPTGQPRGPWRRPGPTSASVSRRCAKKNLRKVFPDHWSFMLGEIALWSFVVLLLTGVFLTLWFQPSMAEVQYEGSYAAAARHPHVAGLRLDARHLLRRPRRPADAPDAPLGGDAVRRLDDDPPAARVLHRRVPQAPRAELGDRLPAPAARHARGVHRLLAPRRPAVGDRHPRRRRVRQGDARRGDLRVVLPVRRRVPRRRDHPAALHRSTSC